MTHIKMPTQNIPSGWKKVKLGEVVEINPKISLIKGEKYPYIEMQAVRENGFRGETYILEREYNGGGSKFEKGDILFARITPCLQNSKFTQVRTIDKGFGSTEFFVFRNKEGITDKNYLFYLLLTPFVKDTAEKSMIGASGRQRADLKSLKNLSILLPSLPVQHKVASILSAYDDLIENNNKRIKILEEMGKAIFDDMMKQAEEKGELEEAKAEEIINFIRGVEPGSKNYKSIKGENDIPFIRVKDLNNGQSETYIDLNLCKGKVVSRNEVLVSFDGTIGVVKRGLEGCYSSGIRKLKGKIDYITDEFLYLLFQTDDIQNIIKAHAKGTTILHAGGSIKFMKINLPSQQTLQNFNNQIKPILDEILNLQLQNKNLKQTRDLLIPRLVSGKLDVESLKINM